MEKKSRRLYLDIIRIIACFLVIYNHTPAFQMYIKETEASGLKQAVYMFLSVFCKISVPLFFMVSGALLLGRKENIKEVLRKRVSRILIVMVISEFVMFYVSNFAFYRNDGEYTFSFLTFIRGVIECKIYAVPYWYLYTYLGFLLCLPFLQRVAQGMNDSEFWVLLIFMFLKNTLEPIVNVGLTFAHREPVWISAFLTFPFAMDTAIFYSLIGYYLDRRVDVTKMQNRHAALCMGIIFVGLLLTYVLLKIEFIQYQIYTENYIFTFAYFTAMAVFLLIKYLAGFKWTGLFSGKFGAFLGVASTLTFGIYLMEPFFKGLLFSRRYEFFNPPSVSPIICSVFWCLLSMLLGGLTTYFLKKIPFLRKLL